MITHVHQAHIHTFRPSHVGLWTCEHNTRGHTCTLTSWPGHTSSNTLAHILSDMHSCTRVHMAAQTHMHTHVCSCLLTHVSTLSGSSLPVYTHGQAQVTGLTLLCTCTRGPLTHSLRHPCTVLNSHILIRSPPSPPTPHFPHWGSSVMGSRQTFEKSSCCYLISGKAGGRGKLIKLGSVASLGKL